MIVKFTIAANCVALAESLLRQFPDAKLAQDPLELHIRRDPRLASILAEELETVRDCSDEILERAEEAACEEPSLLRLERNLDGSLDVAAELDGEALALVEREVRSSLKLKPSVELLQALVGEVPELLWEFHSGGITDTYARETLRYAVDRLFFSGALSWPCNGDSDVDRDEYFRLYVMEAGKRGLLDQAAVAEAR